MGLGSPVQLHISQVALLNQFGTVCNPHFSTCNAQHMDKCMTMQLKFGMMHVPVH